MVNTNGAVYTEHVSFMAGASWRVTGAILKTQRETSLAAGIASLFLPFFLALLLYQPTYLASEQASKQRIQG
jgi:hypothetical protein